MADLVQGQQRLLGIVDCVLHLGPPLARERQLRARHRGRQAHADPRRRAPARRPASPRRARYRLDRMRPCACWLLTKTACSMPRQDEIGDELPAVPSAGDDPRAAALSVRRSGAILRRPSPASPVELVAAYRELCRRRCCAATAPACCRTATQTIPCYPVRNTAEIRRSANQRLQKAELITNRPRHIVGAMSCRPSPFPGRRSTTSIA